MPSLIPIPAAQYLRMSTEHQQYSLDNQAAAIQQYAESHGFVVVKTYADAGKSGLMLKHRNALSQLLQDVVCGTREYAAILVYDVSRWGRFQDTDEAAHYEFLCKKAGIPVQYCAEQFANDGTLSSMVLKAIKRTMAGEFSRELSVKTFDGKKRIAQLGFRQGGRPGYGLRRMLVSADGKRKQELSYGEYKSISTDRIILIPGPRAEVEVVREMYRMALSGRRVMWIVRELNRRGIPSSTGTRWEVTAVLQVLKNPKYMGCNTWGVTSQKLHTRAIRVPNGKWVVNPNAFAPIVDARTFGRVQSALRNKTLNQSDQQIIVKLKHLLAQHGYITLAMIDKNRRLPSVSTLCRRFGDMRRVYELAGYDAARRFYRCCDRGKQTINVREDLVAQVQRLFPGHASILRPTTHRRPILFFDGCLPVSVRVCQSRRTSGGRVWVLHPSYYSARDWKNITLLCLLNGHNDAVERYCLFPFLARVGPMQFRKNHPWLTEARRVNGLSDLYNAVTGLAASREQT